jgi:thioredoxin reductase (NADPH)
MTVSALERRFGADFRVRRVASARQGLEVLETLARENTGVPMVAADLNLPETGGLRFLEQAHSLHPGSSRVLLVAMDQYHTRIPFTELPTLQRATALGRIDSWILKGWTTPEEWLYPQVQETLTAWTLANQPHHVVYRVVGEQWDPRSHEIRDLLSRNGVPFEYLSADTEQGRQLIREMGVDVGRLPAVIRHDGVVQHDPSTADIAASHGIPTRVSSELHDLAIVGAGPAGLGAAVYAASEGLRTLVVEAEAIGGQAGTSSMIRNYLGFPSGISGAGLAHRAWQQAVLFRAQFLFSQRATALRRGPDHRVIALSDGSEVIARAVIVAAGASYRRLGIPVLDRLVGAGVYYGAAGVEAPAMADLEVYIVGGANSAGQAALHLAKFAARVVLLVRGRSLTASMSDYLVIQLQATPNVEVRLNTRIVDGRGDSRLEALTLDNVQTGQREEVPAVAVFVLIGAQPHTEWLRETVRLDDGGFILTGRDIPSENWPLDRPPLPFETSMPGVFAAGDVRHGSVKRVAGAVGEGSVSVGSVHQYLSATKVGRTGG